ncbi:MAG: hypothetical protein KAG37_07880, partial [Flavobacteriales bacterium]|nr:hypothetical protein [Flavobacteriales bacterium]
SFLKRLIELVKSKVNNRIKRKDMSTIKMFTGKEKPILKKGEWASDGNYTYLGLENGKQKVFQGVFDTGVDQTIGGFQYYKDRGREWVIDTGGFGGPVPPGHGGESQGYWKSGKAGILIPAGTPFSKLQKLLYSLPRGLKYSKIEQGEEVREWMKIDSLDIYFEDGTYINDLGRELEIRDIGYKIKFLADTSIWYDDNYDEIKVFFEDDKFISVQNSNVFIARIKFTNAHFLGYLFKCSNTDLVIQNCILKKQTRGNNNYIADAGHNTIDLYKVLLDLDNKEYEHLSIFSNLSTGSSASLTSCKAINSFYADYDIRSIVSLMTGGIVIAGDNDLRIKEKSSMPNISAGGLEIIDGVINNPNANIISASTINQMIDAKIQNL